MARYINPYTDFGFKKLFGEEANKDLLTDFLNQLLPPHHQIASLRFKNSENLPDLSSERKAIFDIHCVALSGEHFVVEMQLAFKTAEVANMTPQQRDEYEQTRLSYIEVKEAVNTAEMDGYKRAKIETARELKQSGVDRSIIKKSTGLTDEEIDKL